MRKTIFFLLMIILSTSAYSIGLSSGRSYPKPILFEPGLVFSEDLVMSQYKYESEPYIEGDLVEYAIITNHKDYGDYQTFTVILTLPEKLDRAGIHTLYIGARELPPTEGGIVGLTRVRKLRQFLVLYDEKIAKFYELLTPNVNEGQTTKFSFKAESLSKQKITSIEVDIKIYDFNRKLIKTLNIEKFELASAEKKTLSVEFDSQGLTSGQYFAEAEIHWENEITKLESSFKIGALNLQILNFTRNFTANQINKINIEVESKWNGKINDVYAQLFIDDEEQTSTQTYNFGPFERKEITGYLDLSYVEGGMHTLRIILNYGNEKTVVEDDINIVGEGKKKPRVRKPITITLNSTEIMMLLVIIVLILAIVVILQQRKKK
ncbi:MAG: hypothetical protein ISS25_01980 [Nanoarchaeota archaeon]|nr:hypothetical protein [DPANN group archaeon]MBL7116575.1 hypothetical protein [Nanoarchaeota archaeon]